MSGGHSRLRYGFSHLVSSLIVLASLLPTVALRCQALEAEWSTTIRAQLAENIARGHDQSTQFESTPKIVLSFDSDAKLTAIGRLRTEQRDDLGPEFIGLHSYSAASRPQLLGDSSQLALRELYWQFEVQDYHVTIGKQQVVWGEADGLKVLDIVNPQSFHHFILEDFDTSRIPTWMANIETRLGAWNVQLLWIPDQTYHAFAKPGGRYAVTSPQLIPRIDLAVPGATVVLTNTEKPGSVVKDSDAGIRFSQFYNGWDISVNYLYHYHDLPIFQQSWDLSGLTSLVTVTPKYKRTHTFGGTASTAIGNWVMRGELGFSSDRYFVSDRTIGGDGLVRGRELAYVFGLDWSGLENTLISGQLFQSHLSENDSMRDRIESNATLLARRMYWNDTLTLEMIWLGNINNEDGLLRPKISYEWRDDVKTWIGADLFYGNRAGIFGQFDDNDQLVIGLEIDF